MSAQITQFKAAGVERHRPHRRARARPASVGARRGRRRASTCRSSATTRSSRPACSRPGRRPAEEAPLSSRRRSTSFDDAPRPARGVPGQVPRHHARASAWSSAPAMGELMKQILDTACENGDLTRAGRARGESGAQRGRHRRPRRAARPVGRARQVPEPGELHPAAGRRPRWRQAPAARDRARPRAQPTWPSPPSRSGAPRAPPRTRGAVVRGSPAARQSRPAGAARRALPGGRCPAACCRARRPAVVPGRPLSCPAACCGVRRPGVARCAPAVGHAGMSDGNCTTGGPARRIRR